MSRSIEQARVELRARQGQGARYDAPGAPARELDWARRGTAYFARLLNDMSDADLDGASALPGLTRRHIVAHIGYQARLLGEIVAWVRTAQEGPFPKALDVPSESAEQGRTLPARALRYLFHHSEVHLNVEWRDLTDADWDGAVIATDGRRLAMRDTPIVRARSLWSCALDLNAGGRRSDAPKELVVTPDKDGL